MTWESSEAKKQGDLCILGDYQTEVRLEDKKMQSNSKKLWRSYQGLFVQALLGTPGWPSPCKAVGRTLVTRWSSGGMGRRDLEVNFPGSRRQLRVQWRAEGTDLPISAIFSNAKRPHSELACPMPRHDMLPSQYLPGQWSTFFLFIWYFSLN